MFFKEKPSFAKKRVQEQNKPEPLLCGLRVRRASDGHYGVYQMQTGDEVVLTDTKEKAAMAKRELDTIIDWETEEDVYLQILQGETEFVIFQKMNKIIDRYGLVEWVGEEEQEWIEEWEDESDEEKDEETEKELEGEGTYRQPTEDGRKNMSKKTKGDHAAYGATADEQGGISYLVKEERGGTKSVKGELVAPGLAVHHEGKGEWTIDHIPTANMLTVLPNRREAFETAEAIATIVEWGEERAMELFVQVPEFGTYLRSVKEAVQANEPIPEKPLSLVYKLEFFRLNVQNGDAARFNRAADQLANLVGLDRLKEEVLEMIYTNAGQEMQEGHIKQEKTNMHMVFSGPAGTGKTEVARIMSDILASLGYLEKGHLIEANRQSLVAEHIGGTEEKTAKIIEEAMGGTLFIDEAYDLVGDSNDFGQKAINALIKEMEDKRGQFCLILAGYPAPMQELLDMNEGFRSRIKKTFHFPAYTPNQVQEIVLRMLRGKGFVFGEEVEKTIAQAIQSRTKQGAVEGNARTARNITEAIMWQSKVRLGKHKNQIAYDAKVLYVEDVLLATDEKRKGIKREELDGIRKKAQEKMNNLVGLEALKKEMQRIFQTILVDNMRYEKGLASTKTRKHMMFYGPPGTGKTTVARIIGEFLKGAGVLSSGHFVEASRAKLVGQHVGETAQKVKKVVADAMDGILFIDEAYTLANGGSNDFGKEALDEIIKHMEDSGDRLVVIFAGYREDMEKLFALNDGLVSRVPYHFDFPHYNAEELYGLATVQLEAVYGLYPTEDAKQAMWAYINDTMEATDDGFIEGDGRWVRNVNEVIKTNQSARLYQLMENSPELTNEQLQEVTEADVPMYE